MSNPRVYFDTTIGGEPAGRIIMEVRRQLVFRTASGARSDAERATLSCCPMAL